MDKMYVKDFVEALDKVGFDFKIWGFEGILNILSMYSRLQADNYLKLADECPEIDYRSLAKWELCRSNKIYDLLEERGYFDDKCN